MTRAVNNELELFLATHPTVQFFDAFVNDLNTVERGKRIDRAGIQRVFAQGDPADAVYFHLTDPSARFSACSSPLPDPT